MNQFKFNITPILNNKFQLISVFLVSFIITTLTLYKTLTPIWIGLASVQTITLPTHDINGALLKLPSAKDFVTQAKKNLEQITTTLYPQDESLSKWFKPTHLGGAGNLSIYTIGEHELIIKAYAKDVAHLRKVLIAMAGFIKTNNDIELEKCKTIIEGLMERYKKTLQIASVGEDRVVNNILKHKSNTINSNSANLTDSQNNIASVFKDFLSSSREVELIESNLVHSQYMLKIINASIAQNRTEIDINIYQAYPRKIMLLLYGLTGAIIILFIHALLIGAFIRTNASSLASNS